MGYFVSDFSTFGRKKNLGIDQLFLMWSLKILSSDNLTSGFL